MSIITKKTVFILGAGASIPYGYPSMDELRDDIVQNFNSNYKKYFLENAWDVNQAQAIDRLINKFLVPFEASGDVIDVFLSNPENASIKDLGRLAIACSIYTFELSSTFNHNTKHKKYHLDWYRWLIQQLKRPLDKKYEISKHNIGFVTFNYDRSLEYYFYDSIKHSNTNIASNKITEEINQIPIHHVYGQLIKLPWQKTTNKEDQTSCPTAAYKNISSSQIVNASNNIEVIEENRKSNQSVNDARKLINSADRIFFLGFGFDQANLRLLKFPDIIEAHQDIFCTAYGINQVTYREINHILKSNKRPAARLFIENCDSKKLLEDYLFRPGEKS